MSVGDRIKQARTAAKMTQKELANKIGVRDTAIANYENGVSHPREENYINYLKRSDATRTLFFKMNLTRTQAFSQTQLRFLL